MARKAPPRGQAKRKASAKAAPSRRLTAYQKRLRDYQRKHPGWRSDAKWKQKARGHVEREHIGRRANEIARLEAFAEQQAARFRGGDAAHLLEAFMAKYRREGIGWLGRIERWIAEHNARYLAQPERDRHGRRPTLGINLDDMSEVEELPPETFGYH